MADVRVEQHHVGLILADERLQGTCRGAFAWIALQRYGQKELILGDKECQNARRGDGRQCERQLDQSEGAKMTGAIDAGGLHQVARHHE